MSIKKSEEKLGMASALLERLEKQRLPRLLMIQERVSSGMVLSDTELHFLQEVSTDARHLEPMIDQNPEYQSLFIKLVGLYEEITEQALKNEQNSG